MASSGLALSLLVALLALQVATNEAKFALPNCHIEPVWDPLFEPDVYNVKIEPDLKAQELRGSIEALITYTAASGSKSSLGGRFKNAVKSCTKSDQSEAMRRVVLVLGSNLNVDDLKVFRVDSRGAVVGQRVNIERACVDREHGIMEFVLEGKLHKGDKFSMQIEYQGKIEEGSGIEDAATDQVRFYPRDTSVIMPCFKEIEFTSLFSLELVHDKDLTSFSNAPVASEEIDQSNQRKKHVKFGTTMSIPVQAFSFAVGNYESIKCESRHNRGQGGAPVVATVYTAIGRSEEARNVLDMTCAALDRSLGHFISGIPAKKVDFVMTANPRLSEAEWGFFSFGEQHTQLAKHELAKFVGYKVLQMCRIYLYLESV